MKPWAAPAPADDSEPVLDPSVAILRDHLTDSIWDAAMTETRSLQTGSVSRL